MLIDIENRNPHYGPGQDDRADPFYATLDSAAFDIPSPAKSTLFVGQTAVIKTGLFLKQPKRFSFWWLVRKALKLVGVVPMLEIRSRSGLSVKGITVANAPGTVDADYPEEIGVILVNGSEKPFEINVGDRVAQGLVTLAFRAGGVTRKGAKRKSGFGSTGK